MASNLVREGGKHVGSIWAVNMEQLDGIKDEIERCTKGLRSKAAGSTCCIYKVPSKYKDNNIGHWYRPRIVSIGPYYYNGRELYSDYKYQCLGSFLSRAKGVTLADCMKKLHPLETKTRQCYSAEIEIDLSSEEFLEMMLLDASFILELFYKFQDLGMLETHDPLALLLRWRLPYFYVDLLLLQNQIPFLVLQELFDISKMPNDPSKATLPLLALRFFNNILRRPNKVIERYANPENPPLHLLDLVRSSLIPNDPTASKDEDTQIQFCPFEIRLRVIDQMPLQDNTQIQSIPCISNLRSSGIRVRPGKAEADSFLAVKFENGLIEMPSIIINDFMRYLLLNCVAFEQCHKSCSNHVTAYATLLDCLVNTSADVKYLREHIVIDNYLADDREVALFINSLGKDVTFDTRDCYLSKLFNDVDKYYRNSRHVYFASFRRTYFNTPWWFIPAFAAILLLLLTIVQTFFSIISYVRPNN
ncbi:UPF0481 protein At3g47200-like [Corylus avellana]|uniref:UPF0481 protein At3g47200-like n=1 Tax=Corylus avellana TaxID=13451 RepID=UPI001E22801A|nr:UPF0481 protein At3g47200-like [Corylus avellana]